MRVGLGFDIHAFAEGRTLMLGGIPIPHEQGLHGHSDGDVLLHAISDALLGAAADGDIGLYFPDTDASIKGIDSREIISHVVERVGAKGFSIVNVDAVIICETPKISPHRDKLRESIARLLRIGVDRVSLKGKTAEGLGTLGRGAGIAVHAVCLLAE